MSQMTFSINETTDMIVSQAKLALKKELELKLAEVCKDSVASCINGIMSGIRSEVISKGGKVTVELVVDVK